VTVNCVAPGWVDTEMVAGPMGGGGRERIAANIPLGPDRHPRGRGRADRLPLLALARHVTGEVLNVNGGSVLCG
jgi:3-oxoacyl-[acyl-carrier protein] reductase